MATFTIFDISGNPILTTPTNEARWERELMKSNFIYLSFNTAEKIILPAYSYIVFTYHIDTVREVTRKFSLMDPYEPTQVNEMAWKYTPVFQHPEMLLSRAPFFIFSRNSKGEKIKKFTFPYYGTFVDISNVIKTFLNDNIKLENCGWNVIFLGLSDKWVKISFDNNDFRSALGLIAKAISNNCEWHIDYDNEIIYFGIIAIDYNNQTQRTKVLPNHMGTISSKTYKRPNFKEKFLTDEESDKILELIRRNKMKKKRRIVFGCTNGIFGFSLFKTEEPKDLWYDVMITEEQAQSLGYMNAEELMKAIVKDENSFAYVKAGRTNMVTTVELSAIYDFNEVIKQVLKK